MKVTIVRYYKKFVIIIKKIKVKNKAYKILKLKKKKIKFILVNKYNIMAT